MLVRSWKNPKSLLQIPTRNGYGDGLVEAGKKDPNLMVICADLTESTRTEAFKEAFPDRFIQFGVAEQAMAAVGAGMALAGKTVFITSYACFSPGRNWEQIRTTGCLQKTNLKIAGAHAGISVGPDGATHQMTEDIALMRVLPEMTVLIPCDAIETKKATVAAAKINGPAYIRFAREKSPVFTTESAKFEIGKAQVLRKGNDVAIIGCGPLVYECLMAAEELAKSGIEARVINNSSIKPMDEKTILKAARECGAIVTVEEAQAAAGMGGAVCELVSSEYPVPVERVGLQDEFGQSGKPAELLEHYKLTAPWIVKAVRKVIKKK
ncbi:transketolase [Candidatus Uhrbacteria bacterium CG_4_9_14_0_2_um_filter_41_50]|uniref:Transketolase n=1 Tax=Candidatus Uhrbacteria bacterium CG_4_9_14_0_2_um_filter_41_50 TaxID=1975031 RepID=A0A2M8EPJ8_9BACT|nr:MAG: transketolase [Candidatus Uhrbacteria bacterium CG_4_10_14_3_um_filter_41_21]PIZ54833.1 MAG: transketolase [Candidatus Uhrbacteria bacterium CG_4_10_14_0_2_um_filter_41_21]PJB84323.1 MAG: transketolase [Candidatus Uhrbacteria bacterium CG_4_9_14_0_8_um_filter_41_16]PJC24669.1 MAG: transketolase [Candidatus Uhrbacteria bacterium CG_4_9_14_0_2_um_filter_41_50]PJE75058.1 MAG: transketolase [Candidatus Uhrbacteria bacterium CG10_big_fil_rev_8_21_14_0_10_41_26]